MAKAVLLVNILVLCSLPFLVTPYMVWASTAYSLLTWGLWLRKYRAIHAKLMSAGIFMDLALVLLLEFQRDAIGTALDFSLTPFQQSHIGASTIALLLYFPVFILGLGRYQNRYTGAKSRRWHIYLGVAAFIFRSAGFLLMFSLLDHMNK